MVALCQRIRIIRGGGRKNMKNSGISKWRYFYRPLSVYWWIVSECKTRLLLNIFSLQRIFTFELSIGLT